MNKQRQSPPDRAKRSAVVIERTYQARVEELWELWTTKEGFESWWAPEGCRSEVHTIEARVGGTLLYNMIAVAPAQIAEMKQMGLATSHVVRARFSEIRPNQRLTITHVIDLGPGVKPEECTIAVDFFPAGESVRMVVTIEPMHDEEFTQKSIKGFISQLRKLEGRFLEGRFAEPAGP
ncbi:MAG: SRPBCC domain-containing protein [Steroidobacteraceae bacterium]